MQLYVRAGLEEVEVKAEGEEEEGEAGPDWGSPISSARKTVSRPSQGR
jgi:hypothetical protein